MDALTAKGYDKTDLILYIAKILTVLGKKVLFVDTTLTKKGMSAEAKATGDALATKVNITDIVDDLTSVADDKPLSANQGRILKKQIDEIDRELMTLLSKRMEIARGIGELKRKMGMVAFQPYRYNEIMERYIKFCADGKLEVDAVREIFELIHSESIRQQLTVMNNNDA